MPYLGNNPTANFATVTKDTFSGNGSTTAFTLSKTATTNGVAVYVENVRQIPTTAYAISGTTLTFTGAPVSGTNNIYVMHHNTPVSTATHPSAQALTATSGTFTSDVSLGDSDKLILGAGSDLQLYHDGSHSYIDEVGTGSLYVRASIIRWTNADGSETLGGVDSDGGWFLKANNSNALVIDANGHVTKPLQPAFSVTSNQMNNIAINNTTTIQFANEIFDQNADFNHSNYTFTAPVTGKYMLNVNLRMDNVDIAHMYMYMILATSNREYEWLLDISEYQNDLDYLPFTINVLADMDASDTALVKMHIPNAGSAQSDVVGSNKTTFSGFLAC